MATTIQTITRLERALRGTGIPIDGVSMQDVNDRATWRVDFRPEATEAHRTQAAQLILTFDPDAASYIDAEKDEEAAQQVDAQRAIRATVVWTLRRVLGRNPTPAEIATARSEWIAIFKSL